jgi:hypothetical protein
MRKITRGNLFDASYAVDLQSASNHEVREFFHGMATSWNDRLEKCPNIFIATKGRYRDLCQEIVENGEKGDHEVRGTVESFAYLTLNYFKHVDKAIEDGDAASAARFAFSAGEQFELMRLKFNFELDAERGTKVIGGARNSAQEKNKRHIEPRKKRMNRMSELTKSISATQASRQCETEGLGKAQNVLRMWNRYKNNEDN